MGLFQSLLIILKTSNKIRIHQSKRLWSGFHMRETTEFLVNGFVQLNSSGNYFKNSQLFMIQIYP